MRFCMWHGSPCGSFLLMWGGRITVLLGPDWRRFSIKRRSGTNRRGINRGIEEVNRLSSKRSTKCGGFRASERTRKETDVLRQQRPPVLPSDGSHTSYMSMLSISGNGLHVHRLGIFQCDSYQWRSLVFIKASTISFNSGFINTQNSLI